MSEPHEGFLTDDEAAFVRTCKWEYNPSWDDYAVGCLGLRFCISMRELKGNKFKYCPYCGRKIEVTK